MIPVSAYAQGIGLAGPQPGMTGMGASVPQMASSVSPLAPNSEISFHPDLKPRHEDKQQPWYSWLAGNFNLNSFFTFLPILRAFGYTFDIMYTPLTGKLQDTHIEAAGKLRDQSQNISRFERLTLDIYGDKPPSFDGGADFQRLRGEKAFYQHVIDKVEGVAFSGLALVSCYSLLNTLLKDARLAVGAELGKEPENVNLHDLRKSANPMVATMVDKALWQCAIRTVSGGLFFKGLQWGVLGNVLSITTERTIFYHPTAFDILQKSVNNIQINNLGEESKLDMVDALVKTLQAERLDHRRTPWTREELHSVRPVLEEVAQDIIDKRFGFAGALYVMGAGLILPGKPEQSMANFRHVHEVGVQGVMQEGLWMRKHEGVPSTKVWEARVEKEAKEIGYEAKSARRDELYRQHQQILARGPMMPTGRRIDPSEGNSSNIIVL